LTAPLQQLGIAQFAIFSREGQPSTILDNYRVRFSCILSKPDMREAGRFVHSHDACFDHDGNIYITEWVTTGRITKLEWLG